MITHVDKMSKFPRDVQLGIPMMTRISTFTEYSAHIKEFSSSSEDGECCRCCLKQSINETDSQWTVFVPLPNRSELILRKKFIGYRVLVHSNSLDPFEIEPAIRVCRLSKLAFRLHRKMSEGKKKEAPRSI